MRLALANATTLLALAACAPTPGPAAIVAQCRAISAESFRSAGQSAINQTFGAELIRRFGSEGVNLRAEQSTDETGNLTVTYRRIGPAEFAPPEPGKGGELQIVLEKCTYKILQTRKLAELEIAPLALPAHDPAL